jgi:hypothetical protein
MAEGKSGSPGTSQKPRDMSIEAIESRETSILKEMKKEVEALKEVSKRVKAEGVKDGIDRVGNLLIHLINNRSERVASRQAQKLQRGDGPDLARRIDSLREDILARVNQTSEKIINATKDIVGNQVVPTPGGASEVMKDDILKAIADVKSGLEAPAWTEVVKRSKRNNQAQPAPKNDNQTTASTRNRPPTNSCKSRVRPPAIMVNVNKEDFPQLARRIRCGVDGEIIGSHIVGMRQAKSGGLLITLNGDREQVEKVRAEIARSAGDGVEVKSLQQRQTLEIRDLDEWTDKDEVVEAISRQTETPVTLVKVLSLRKKFGGAQAAIVSVPLDSATKIISKERLRIGMVSCRVRIADGKIRCFRCLSFGHTSSSCKGPDRSDCCRRCGETGHKAVACKAPASDIDAFAKLLGAVQESIEQP